MIFDVSLTIFDIDYQTLLPLSTSVRSGWGMREDQFNIYIYIFFERSQKKRQRKKSEREKTVCNERKRRLRKI